MSSEDGKFDADSSDAKIDARYERHEKNKAYDDPDIYIWNQKYLDEVRTVIGRLNGEILKALDVGTGDSISLIGMMRKFPEDLRQWPICSIDISRRSLELSRMKLSEKKLDDSLCVHIHADARQMCFNNDTFNLVGCTLSLHEISAEGREFREKGLALSEILRVCKLGGHLLLVDSVSDFKNKLWRHEAGAKRKGSISYISAGTLTRVFREILPDSPLAVTVFSAHKGATKFFMVVVNKLDEEIKLLRALGEKIDSATDQILDEIYKVRLSDPPSRI